MASKLFIIAESRAYHYNYFYVKTMIIGTVSLTAFNCHINNMAIPTMIITILLAPKVIEVTYPARKPKN